MKAGDVVVWTSRKSRQKQTGTFLEEAPCRRYEGERLGYWDEKKFRGSFARVLFVHRNGERQVVVLPMDRISFLRSGEVPERKAGDYWGRP